MSDRRVPPLEMRPTTCEHPDVPNYFTIETSIGPKFEIGMGLPLCPSRPNLYPIQKATHPRHVMDSFLCRDPFVFSFDRSSKDHDALLDR
jgi:hypothetical protein